MKLLDILSPNLNKEEWESKGYKLPSYDLAALARKTYESPTWVHFGGGNIFRTFPAAILNEVLNSGQYDRGVIVAETYDFEIIDKVYAPYNNLSLFVSLCSDGSVDKTIIGSITESLKADPQFDDWKRLQDIFRNPSLQMISFTITEKGYAFNETDLLRGLSPSFAMGKVATLLLERFYAGHYPLTIQSMDNCSHNGDIAKEAILTYAKHWLQHGLVPSSFIDYLCNEQLISFPWSMIDKITPRPHEKVKQMLTTDGFEDNEYIETKCHTFTAPFVNAEEVQYLVIEDKYTHGRPPLEQGGVLYTTREIVDKVETMKVTTCLNPLHTALAIYGCLLGYNLISAEMADDDLRLLIQKIGYMEAMPVVTNPGILNPYEFIGEVIQKRLPNPFMPDAPQRIAMDTSQKLSIRFGETIKKYIIHSLNTDNLILIPLVLAGYARYLKGVMDDGTPFDPSPDPLLPELMKLIAPLQISKPDQDWTLLRQLYSRKDIFGVNLYEIGIGERIESLVRELFASYGAVRKTLHKYVKTR